MAGIVEIAIRRQNAEARVSAAEELLKELAGVERTEVQRVKQKELQDAINIESHADFLERLATALREGVGQGGEVALLTEQLAGVRSELETSAAFAAALESDLGETRRRADDLAEQLQAAVEERDALNELLEQQVADAAKNTDAPAVDVTEDVAPDSMVTEVAAPDASADAGRGSKTKNTRRG